MSGVFFVKPKRFHPLGTNNIRWLNGCWIAGWRAHTKKHNHITSPPVGIETVAFKIQHRVHHVFDDLGSGDAARFSYVSHYEHSDAGAFGEPDQPARALLHLSFSVREKGYGFLSSPVPSQGSTPPSGMVVPSIVCIDQTSCR